MQLHPLLLRCVAHRTYLVPPCAGDRAVWIHAHQGNLPRSVAANMWRLMGHH